MELLTPRLRLREFRESDFEAIRIYDSDPAVWTYEGSPLTPEETRYRLEGAIEWAQEQPRTRYKIAITIPPADWVIGRVSITLVAPKTREWEIGWTMGHQHWGKGYTTEAAQAMLHYAFTELNAHRVTAFCHSENIASIRVMEKLGMQREGYLRETRWLNDHWCDELVYAVLDREWNSK